MLNESVDKYRGLNMFPVWEIVESVGVRKEEFASRTSLNLHLNRESVEFS